MKSVRLIGKRVDVYRNLRSKCWSVRLNGCVVRHAKRILLSDCKFVVSEAGRQRVLRERRKNVHAWVNGVVVGTKGCFGIDKNDKRGLPVKIHYNPYLAATFTDWHGAVKGARAALLNEKGVTACYLT